jgi:hypothetical protein
MLENNNDSKTKLRYGEERAVEDLKMDFLQYRKPCMCGYNCAIVAVALVFVATCALAFGACIRDFYSWGSVVLSLAIIVVLAVLAFYLEKALFAARRERLALYGEFERKRVEVYGKVLDAWLVGEQKKIKDEYGIR